MQDKEIFRFLPKSLSLNDVFNVYFNKFAILSNLRKKNAKYSQFNELYRILLLIF